MSECCLQNGCQVIITRAISSAFKSVRLILDGSRGHLLGYCMRFLHPALLVACAYDDEV